MANEHIFKSKVIVTGSIETTAGFVGSGAGLTGITATAEWDGSRNGNASITGSLIVSGSSVTVDLTKTTAISGSIFSGSFTGNGSALTDLNINNIIASGVHLTGSYSGSFTGDGSTLTGLDTFPHNGNAIITGSLIVSSSKVDLTKTTAISGSIFSGSFVGNGAGLAGLTAAPAGANTEIQLNNSGTTGATSNLRYSAGTLLVSESIHIHKSGSGELGIFQYPGKIDISTLQAKGNASSAFGKFVFQGSTGGGTITEYLTLSTTVTNAGLSLIKGGGLSVGNSPATPTAAQGNLYVKRIVSSSSDTVATLENTDSSAYGGGGFIDIVGNSNDYATGGIRVKNGTHIDGEIYYTAGSRSIILEANKRTGSSSGGLQFKWQGSTKFLINASGNVGIGTTTPAQKLDVQGKIVAKDKVLINGTDFDMASLESTAGHKIARVDTQDGIYDYGNQAMYINSGSVGIGTASPEAILHISSTTDGVLLPRLTSAQVVSISSPKTGLTVYNTSLNALAFYDGTRWKVVTSAAMPTP